MPSTTKCIIFLSTNLRESKGQIEPLHLYPSLQKLRITALLYVLQVTENHVKHIKKKIVT